MLKKAFSMLTIKSVREVEGERLFSGVATTPTPDSYEDIVEPKGAIFSLPMPFLWQHDAGKPIGWITAAKVSKEGIEIEGKVATVKEEGHLKEQLTTYWQMIKLRLVRGLSIGFKGIAFSDIPGTRYGRKYTKWTWLETSAVTIPANMEASITNIKAAFGKQNNPGASGVQITKGKRIMKTIFEQLAELKESRATKSARMSEISEGIQAKTATRDDAAEFDNLAVEIEDLDDCIRVKTAEVIAATTAKPAVSSVKAGPTIIVKKQDPEDSFAGQSFTRIIMAKALAKIEDISPVAIAQKRWGKTNPMLISVIKAAVEGGGSGSGEWGAELVSADARYTGDFIKMLTSRTVYDKLPLRVVPANVTIKGQDGAATGYWVGESASIPVSAQSFSSVNLSPLKVGALAVVSNELLRDSSPAAEALVRDALIDASAQRVDSTFISATAASAGVSPAGILNGITPDSASGTDADALRADIRTLYGDFITAKNASGLYIVMNPALAKSIQMLYNALGNPEFPDITQDGGKLLGDPVVTGDNVAADDLILLKPSDIYRIGDSGVQVSISKEAAIEMDSAPAMESQGPTAASGALVGMFQTESTAIKVVRSINFQVRRTATSVVGFVGDAAYDGSAVS